MDKCAFTMWFHHSYLPHVGRNPLSYCDNNHRLGTEQGTEIRTSVIKKTSTCGLTDKYSVDSLPLEMHLLMRRKMRTITTDTNTIPAITHIHKYSLIGFPDILLKDQWKCNKPSEPLLFFTLMIGKKTIHHFPFLQFVLKLF